MLSQMDVDDILRDLNIKKRSDINKLLAVIAVLKSKGADDGGSSDSFEDEEEDEEEEIVLHVM